ncbi:MAG: hypothetical protein ACD_75C01884G0001 [uncultured bacterium]|nr:MAG: hypothetical protein ACD_75C01884G0001 [uncultured bacterium]
MVAADDNAVPHEDDADPGRFKNRVLLLVDGRKFCGTFADALFHLLVDQAQFPGAGIDLMLENDTADKTHDQKAEAARRGDLQPERPVEVDVLGGPPFERAVIDRVRISFQARQMAVDGLAHLFRVVPLGCEKKIGGVEDHRGVFQADPGGVHHAVETVGDDGLRFAFRHRGEHSLIVRHGG